MDKRETWQALQDKEYKDFLDNGAYGIFSVKQTNGAAECGSVISELLPTGGDCLDIGCGVLPLPYYMEVADKVSFTGIDPFDVPGERGFTFRVGVAEDLPWDDKTFDCVLFSTSLDHCVDPTKASQEALRVLKPGGFVVMWGSQASPNSLRYKRWKKAPKPALYDDHHMWAFSRDDLISLFGDPFMDIIVGRNDGSSHVILTFRK